MEVTTWIFYSDYVNYQKCLLKQKQFHLVHLQWDLGNKFFFVDVVKVKIFFLLLSFVFVDSLVTSLSAAWLPIHVIESKSKNKSEKQNKLIFEDILIREIIIWAVGIIKRAVEK